MREFDRIPDYLVAGLLPSGESAEDRDRITKQEDNSIWQRTTVGDIPMIVRAANRRNPSARRAGSRTKRI